MKQDLRATCGKLQSTPSDSAQKIEGILALIRIGGWRGILQFLSMGGVQGIVTDQAEGRRLKCS